MKANMRGGALDPGHGTFSIRRSFKTLILLGVSVMIFNGNQVQASYIKNKFITGAVELENDDNFVNVNTNTKQT